MTGTKYLLLFSEKIPTNKFFESSNSSYYITAPDVAYDSFGIYVFEKDLNLDSLNQFYWSCAGDFGSAEPEEEIEEEAELCDEYVVDELIEIVNYNCNDNIEIDFKEKNIKCSRTIAYVLKVTEEKTEVIWSSKLSELHMKMIEIKSIFSKYLSKELVSENEYQYFTLQEGGRIEEEAVPLLIPVENFNSDSLKIQILIGSKNETYLNGASYNNSKLLPVTGELEYEPSDNYCEKNIEVYRPKDLKQKSVIN